MKYSKQREAVLRVLKENLIHPTADQVYDILRKEVSNVSLATVYRNLNLLAETGEIKKIEGLDGAMHFDYEMSEHYHFICGKCSKIFDIPIKISSKLMIEASQNTGFDIEGCEISFKGICNTCKKTLKE